ncbi:MAG: hypothetical protein HYW07_23425 [Candidatus Latescibacteria bacterium]|nr:hypothetical protein [Candidatus Latescibacterota bacterium]
MTAEQTAAELTTRDVFQQVDRRLTLIEEDLRSLDEKLDDKIGGLRSDMTAGFARADTQIGGLRSEMYAQFGALRTELGARLDSHLKWTLGTMISLTGLTLTVFGLIVVFLKL